MRLRVLWVVLPAALALASSAHASVWLPAQTLSDGPQSAADTVVATTPQGTTVSAWTRPDGSHRRVEVSVHRPGEAFTAVQDISSLSVDATPPAVAAGSDGSVLIAWEEPGALCAAIIRPGDPVVHPIAVLSFPAGSSLPLSGARTTAATFQGDGSAAIAYVTQEAGAVSMRAATLAPGGTALTDFGSVLDSQSFTGSDSAEFSSPSATDAGGQALFGWVRLHTVIGLPANVTRTFTAVAGGLAPHPRLLDQTTETFNPIPDGTALSGLALASDSAGDILAAWGRDARAAGTSEVVIRAGTASGGFGPTTVPVATGINGPDGIRAAMSGSGQASVAWIQPEGAKTVVAEATRAPLASAFAPPVTVSDPAMVAGVPALAASPAGDIALVWGLGTGSAVVGSPQTVQADLLQPNGSLSTFPGPAATLASLSFPDAAFDGRDLVVAVAGADIAAPTIVRSRALVFDRTPPTLTAVTFPATADPPGTPLAFSAQASDAWSPVTLGWTFGDGGTATGPAPARVRWPGVFGAAVTAADAAGNSASSSAPSTCRPRRSPCRIR